MKQVKVIGEETNILIELDNVSAYIRDTLEALDAIRALTVSIMQNRIYKEEIEQHSGASAD